MGMSVDDAHQRESVQKGLSAPSGANLLLCYWSSQLFQLRALSSTEDIPTRSIAKSAKLLSPLANLRESSPVLYLDTDANVSGSTMLSDQL